MYREVRQTGLFHNGKLVLLKNGKWSHADMITHAQNEYNTMPSLYDVNPNQFTVLNTVKEYYYE